VDSNKSFSMKEIVGVGLISGVTVSLVKLIQWNFHLDDVSVVQVMAAGLTTATYMALGAIGAVFLVDHDAKGQKMLKNAFLMGFVAPSFFLALLNNPAAIRPDFQRVIDRVPKISDLFVKSAHAEESAPTPFIKNTGVGWGENASLKDPKGFYILQKKQVEPSFAAAMKNALGWGVTPASYTYVVGTTEDAQKAAATAESINKILQRTGVKPANAFVVKPYGRTDLYVTVGNLGTPEQATMYADIAKDAGLKILPTANTEDAKKAAALMLGGRVVDAREMFQSFDR
jgi:hypothetical protein